MLTVRVYLTVFLIVTSTGRVLGRVIGCVTQYCPSSYKLGHKVGLSYGGSGSSVGLIMQPAFDVASGVVGLSVF